MTHGSKVTCSNILDDTPHSPRTTIFESTTPKVSLFYSFHFCNYLTFLYIVLSTTHDLDYILKNKQICKELFLFCCQGVGDKPAESS